VRYALDHLGSGWNIAGRSPRHEPFPHIFGGGVGAEQKEGRGIGYAV
jgi:hypothetical protein